VLLHSDSTGMRKPVLQIEMGNHVDFHMTASAMDGCVLASAGRNLAIGGRQDGLDSWKLQAKPGTDAVLITSCMLGLILLRPWPQGLADTGAGPSGRFSMGASTNGGTSTSLRPQRSPLPASQTALTSAFK
jgi:hypothetical protein